MEATAGGVDADADNDVDAAVDGADACSTVGLPELEDDSETPWSKSASSGYGVGTSSGTTKDPDKYERRLGGSGASTPASSYRGSSASAGGSGGASSYHRDRELPADRKYGSQHDTPASRDHASTRASTYSDNMYGTYPHRSRAESSSGPPVTLPPTAGSGRRSRDPSPSAESGGSSLPLQLQLRMLSHRPSYSRSTSRESAPASPSTPASSRFSSATLPRSPRDDKPAPVFGRTDDSAANDRDRDRDRDRERSSTYTPYSASCCLHSPLLSTQYTETYFS